MMYSRILSLVHDIGKRVETVPIYLRLQLSPLHHQRQNPRDSPSTSLPHNPDASYQACSFWYDYPSQSRPDGALQSLTPTWVTVVCLSRRVGQRVSCSVAVWCIGHQWRDHICSNDSWELLSAMQFKDQFPLSSEPADHLILLIRKNFPKIRIVDYQEKLDRRSLQRSSFQSPPNSFDCLPINGAL